MTVPPKYHPDLFVGMMFNPHSQFFNGQPMWRAWEKPCDRYAIKDNYEVMGAWKLDRRWVYGSYETEPYWRRLERMGYGDVEPVTNEVKPQEEPAQHMGPPLDKMTHGDLWAA